MSTTTSSTIKDQHATCSPKATEARSKRVDDTTAVYLRPHEGLIKVRVPVTAGHRCSNESCGHAPIVEVATAWGHRITSDYCRPATWVFGEDWTATWRHADGTACGTDWQGTPRAYVYPQPRCGVCGARDPFERVQRAYGDDVTCTSCGDSHYYSIGD